MTYDGPIVDIDIHNRPASEAEFAKYLPQEWREYADACTKSGILLVKPPSGAAIGLIDGAGHRLDSYPDDGSPSGSSFPILKELFLDRTNLYRGILTHDTGEYALHRNPEFAIAACRAANEWMLGTWMGFDSRLYGTIVVPSATPLDAAAEIRRLAGHPRLACVLHAGNALGLPLGHPVYHPIYEAAADAGLAVLVHPHDRGEVAGTPSTAIENFSHNGLRAMQDISSLVVHGVFEKYPGLKILFTEFGFSWLPTLLANLDRSYPTLSLESHWVKELPSSYVRRSIRLGTQPIETNDRGAVARLLEAAPGVEDILCFSSDFPHYSMDDVEFVSRAIPKQWHRKLFYENACDALGWEYPQSTGTPELAGGVR